MRNGKPKHGRVIYGPRAFHQDATAAMRGDIVRGLIETITNSDDAYGSTAGKTRRIRVEVEHRRGPWKVITRDRATGMSAERMEKAIVNMGERTSGFEAGAEVRGNLGRGAKDLAAFGRVTFESICDGEYAHMLLEPDGATTLDPPRKATDDDTKRLGTKQGNGTVVTIHATESIRCPQHAKLVHRLSRHYQLRGIMADPAREVTLVDLNRDASEVLHYSFPDLPTVLSVSLSVEGYGEGLAQLVLRRNSERYDDPPSDPLRPAGILIRGRRAIYENTFFGFEGNPYAGWFSGELTCRHIDQLAQEYDRRLMSGQRQDEPNPIPIIGRGRDGLQHNHPFYRALAAAAEVHLGSLIAKEEAEARERASTESPRLRRALDGLGRELSKLIDADLQEIDEEGLPSETPPALRLVPEEIVIYMGEDKTASVVAASALCGGTVTVQCDPAGVVDVLDESAVPLGPHRKRPDLLTGQIHLRPLLEDHTLLTATCGDHVAVALVEVRPERPDVDVPAEPVDRFCFARDTYRLAWTRNKPLVLLAPLVDVAAFGTEVRAASSDPGVVVRKGRATLALDGDLEQYVAEVVVEARVLSAAATVTARLGDLVAACKVVVTKEGESPSLSIRMVDQEQGNNRAVVESEDGQTVIKVMGRHPVMRRYRGPAPGFPGDELPTTKVLLAEIVADQVCRMLLERKFPTASGGEQIDAARLYFEHYRYMAKYLTRCHRSLLADADLPQLPAGEALAQDG